MRFGLIYSKLTVGVNLHVLTIATIASIHDVGASARLAR